MLENSNDKKVEEPVGKPKKRGLSRFLPRGGALVELTGAKIVFQIAPVITYVAKN